MAPGAGARRRRRGSRRRRWRTAPPWRRRPGIVDALLGPEHDRARLAAGAELGEVLLEHGEAGGAVGAGHRGAAAERRADGARRPRARSTRTASHRATVARRWSKHQPPSRPSRVSAGEVGDRRWGAGRAGVRVVDAVMGAIVRTAGRPAHRESGHSCTGRSAGGEIVLSADPPRAGVPYAGSRGDRDRSARCGPRPRAPDPSGPAATRLGARRGRGRRRHGRGRRPADLVWRPVSLAVTVGLACTLPWRRVHPLAVVAIAFGTVERRSTSSRSSQDVEWEGLDTRGLHARPAVRAHPVGLGPRGRPAGSSSSRSRWCSRPSAAPRPATSSAAASVLLLASALGRAARYQQARASRSWTACGRASEAAGPGAARHGRPPRVGHRRPGPGRRVWRPRRPGAAPTRSSSSRRRRPARSRRCARWSARLRQGDAGRPRTAAGRRRHRAPGPSGRPGAARSRSS